LEENQNICYFSCQKNRFYLIHPSASFFSDRSLKALFIKLQISKAQFKKLPGLVEVVLVRKIGLA